MTDGSASYQQNAPLDALRSEAVRDPWKVSRIENPYAVACGWLNSDPRVRFKRRRASASSYKSIAHLDRGWGERLDALGVTMREIVWLAGATGHAHGAQREARYLALVEMLEHPVPGESRARAFARVKASLPLVRKKKRPRAAGRRVDG
jgi:hypothetical protein